MNILLSHIVQLSEELLSALDDVDEDDDMRVLVITGAGRGFCSGADVRGMPDGPEARGVPGQRTEMQRQMFRGPKAVLKLHKMNKPTIAMVNGVAAGGGAALALGCDMRVGSEHARFINAFVRIGLSSGWGGPWLYPRTMGIAKALEILLTGDALEAKEAEKVGVLNRLVPADELEKETMALARKLANGPPLAIRDTKLQVYRALGMDLETAMQRADEGEETTRVTEDHQEGVAAFLEKRQPKFQGR